MEMGLLKNKNQGDQTGSAMVIAIFLIFTISIFAMAASTMVSGEFFQSQNHKNSIQANFLARAGIEKAIQTLKHDSPDVDTLNDFWHNNSEFFKDVDLGNGSFSVSHEDGDQEIYGMIDEESKININTASQNTLKGLENLGAERVGMILKSRRNEKFQNPSDLVSRGIISNEEFEGRSGLKNFLTVWGKGKININTAPPEVLLAVLGFYTNEVDLILSYRRGADETSGTDDDGVFRSLEEIKDLSSIKYKLPKDMFTVKSNNFYILSEGFIHKEKTTGRRTIATVVERDNGKISIVHWKTF